MIRRFSIFSGSLFLIMIFTAGAFPMGGRIEKVPMKTYPVTDIPDGEFLRYGFYSSGEKNYDSYLVTKKTAGESGGIFYRIYSADVRGDNKPSANYSDWPSFILIDPVKGTVMESKLNYITNAEDIRTNNNKDIYYHYQMYPAKGSVEYIIKSIKDKNIIESKYQIKVNPEFPSWDGTGMLYFSSRFMDAKSGGIMYMIEPRALKSPIPFTIKYLSTETVKTKAGSFRTKKITIILGDPFLGKLFEPFIKDVTLWIEDSDRRLLIKANFMNGNSCILEGISNL